MHRLRSGGVHYAQLYTNYQVYYRTRGAEGLVGKLSQGTVSVSQTCLDTRPWCWSGRNPEPGVCDLVRLRV